MTTYDPTGPRVSSAPQSERLSRHQGQVPNVSQRRPQSRLGALLSLRGAKLRASLTPSIPDQPTDAEMMTAAHLTALANGVFFNA